MNTSDPVYLQQQDLQSRSAVYNYLNTAVALIPCFFSCIFLGSYSDRAGRKIAILLPIVGSILKLIVFVIVMAFKFHVAFIFIGSFIDGCFGGTATLLMGCFSYISDITSMSNRSFRVVVLEVCIGIGVVISQTIIGVIIHYLGYLWPFAILAGLNFLLFIYVVFRVKETVVPSEPVPFLQATYFTKPLYLYIKDPEKTGRRPKLIISLIVITVISGTALSGVTIEMMKLMNSPLCWSSIYIGLFFAMKYLLATSGTVAYTKLFQVRFGDLKLVIIGCVSAAVYQVAFSFAVHDWQVFTGECIRPLTLKTSFICVLFQSRFSDSYHFFLSVCYEHIYQKWSNLMKWVSTFSCLPLQIS
ncbi:hypothetical protein CAPTEDRAFT_135381 [Capitella teleta]|uniref:Major facilitator superfamily (MFS) profile domain-containing protein n=1 Tax=Capitella teleta TaxID=283909 RepID=R7UUP2_CAPTE|nr:hypothetical protein CAPTEDRAFT_135381 [Capitella teleta]|eukprot:ELU07637.1 hypothetical protein CAPTEDRAFT_135381 [Capitella teleta]